MPCNHALQGVCDFDWYALPSCCVTVPSTIHIIHPIDTHSFRRVVHCACSNISTEIHLKQYVQKTGAPEASDIANHVNLHAQYIRMRATPGPASSTPPRIDGRQYSAPMSCRYGCNASLRQNVLGRLGTLVTCACAQLHACTVDQYSLPCTFT